MPLISIESNQDFESVHVSQLQLIQKVSKFASELLGKSEDYVMVAYRHTPNMLFAGNNQALAYVELKSLGMPEEQTGYFSQSLCELLNTQLGIPTDRIYIEFNSGPRHMWGWNKKTF